jgi:hypothetical protein
MEQTYLYVELLSKTNKMNNMCGRRLDSTGSGKKPVVDSCKNGKKHSGSIKDVEFLDYLCDFSVLKNISS